MRRACAGAFALVLAFASVGACSDDGSTTGTGGKGGASATSAAGTGGQMPCAPNETQACYDGSQVTQHVGACKDGVRTCGVDGAFGSCTGQVLPALKDDCTAPGDEDCDGIDCSELLWGVAYDTDGASAASAVTFGPNGILTVGGTFDGDIVFDVDGYLGGGKPQLFLVQIRPDGTDGWSDAETAGSVALPFDVAAAPDGSVAYAGGFAGASKIGPSPGLVSQGLEDAFVARRAADGTKLWAARYGDAASQRAAHVAIDPNGDVIITGSYTGTIDFGGGVTLSHASPDQDAFLAKVDGTNGVGHWAIGFGDPTRDDAAPALSLDANGNAFIAGGFQGTIVIGGEPALVSPVDSDVYAAKIDSQGNATWAKSFGGAGDQAASVVALDPSGNVFLAGSMHGSLDLGTTLTVPDATSDVFVGKFDPMGIALVGKRFDDTGDTTVVSGATDAAGDFAFTGMTTGSIDFGGGMQSRPDGDAASYVAKFDDVLGHRWSKVFAVEGAMQSNALAVDRGGNGTVAVAGGLAGTVHYDAKAVTSSSGATLAITAAAFQP